MSVGENELIKCRGQEVLVHTNKPGKVKKKKGFSSKEGDLELPSFQNSGKGYSLQSCDPLLSVEPGFTHVPRILWFFFLIPEHFPLNHVHCF